MKPKALARYLQYAITKNYPVLVKGKPGIGKSDIIEDAARQAGAQLIISHPVVSDPTDYKGLPFPSKDGKSADFLAYGDLQKIMDATDLTVYFIDDLGQAPASVQAAVMQLLLARRINGHLVSKKVVFLAATNRREDKAGVSGILEPVKSRFKCILDLEVDLEDWVKWAILNNMPAELIAFIRFKPEHLTDGQPSKDIVNTPCPRTIANLGEQQANNLPEQLYEEVFAGAAGPAFSSEYRAFLDLYKQLPSLDAIIADPTGAQVSTNLSILYALTGGLSRKMSDATITPILKYLNRLAPEFSVCCITDATTRNPKVAENTAYIKWAEKYKKYLVA